MPADPITDAPMPRCPICARPLAADATAARLRPFCSARCADVDLGRWFTGAYRVPGPPEDPHDAPPAEPSSET